MGNLIDYEYKPTRGEAVSGLQSIANGAALTIRPAVGETWVIEMISFGGACTIAFTDGTLNNAIATETAADVANNQVIEKANYTITRDDYITVTNTSGATAVFGYNGFKVHENI